MVRSFEICHLILRRTSFECIETDLHKLENQVGSQFDTMLAEGILLTIYLSTTWWLTFHPGVVPYQQLQWRVCKMILKVTKDTVTSVL